MRIIRGEPQSTLAADLTQGQGAEFVTTGARKCLSTSIHFRFCRPIADE